MIGLPDKVHEAMEENAVRFRQQMIAAWEPIIEPPVCEWIEGNLRFGRGDRGVQLESRMGPFTFSDSPWWRFVVECSAHRRNSSLAVRAATQIHKTANLLIAIPLYLAEFRPAPGMIVVPDQIEAEKIRDRIYSVVQESQRFVKFKRIRVRPKHQWNLKEIDLGSMVIHLAWAGSRQRTRGKPCYYVWFTEVDVYPDGDAKSGNSVEAGKQRTKDVFRYKHIFESSPSQAPSTITDEESTADDRWRWYITCPYCSTKQEARFFQYRKGNWAGRGGIELTVKAIGGDGASLLSPRQAREHAYYSCVNGCKIKSDRKQQVMEAGNWYPLSWKTGDPEPNRVPAHSDGFHMWAIHSANETFGTIAADYLTALRKGLKVDFYGNRLAIAYESETRIPGWLELGKRAAWTHARRTVPDQVWFLTAGIDKQGENNGARYVIRGWAPRRTSWLIDWGWIARDPADTGPILSDLVDVERRVLVPDFQIVNRDNEPSTNPLGHQRLRVRLSGIDTNYLPMQIHRWMRQLPEEWVDRLNGDRLVPGRIRNIRGDHAIRPDVRYRRNLVESNARTGEKYEGGLHLWGIYVYPFYSELTDLIGGEPGQEGSWYVTCDCLNHGREYLEQVTNFGHSMLLDPRKGKQSKWGPRNGRIPVDFWDCEIYAMAMAEMVVGDMGWEPTAWEAWSRSIAQKNHEKDLRAAARRAPRKTDDEIGAR